MNFLSVLLEAGNSAEGTKTFVDKIAEVNDAIGTFVWTNIGLILLIGTGIILTCCTKFFQITHVKAWWMNTVGGMFSKKSKARKNKERGSVSQFQALCTALAATLGTGNIVGVSLAICVGGPGAVFWMWVAAFFGMMTNFSENILGIYYRRKNKSGEWCGGAMYYLQDGLGGYKGCKYIGRVLAVLFSAFAVLASFGIGNMSQINTIVNNVDSAFFGADKPHTIVDKNTYVLSDELFVEELPEGFVLKGYAVNDSENGLTSVGCSYGDKIYADPSAEDVIYVYSKAFDSSVGYQYAKFTLTETDDTDKPHTVIGDNTYVINDGQFAGQLPEGFVLRGYAVTDDNDNGLFSVGCNSGDEIYANPSSDDEIYVYSFAFDDENGYQYARYTRDPMGAIAFGRVKWTFVILGGLLMVLGGVIILGGLQRIATFAERIVPFMAIAYVLGCLIIICVHISSLGAVFGAVFRFAFTPAAVVGGGAGALLKTLIQGFKRGVFSNEAGLGSSVMVHSASNVREPVKQGMWGIFEVFADTLVVCTMTAIVVLTSGCIDLETGTVAEGTNGATLVSSSFKNIFGSAGSMFVSVALLLFAFTTVLGWSHYGAKSFEYLFGTKAAKVYKAVFVLMIIAGAVMTSSLAWDISDTFNGLMMIPNLIGVLSLLPVIIKLTKNFIDRRLRKKTEVEPMLSFDPAIQAEHAVDVEKEMAEENEELAT